MFEFFLMLVVAGVIVALIFGAKSPRSDSVGREPKPFPATASPVSLKPAGDFDFEIVGESFRQAELEQLAGGRTEDGVEVEIDATLVQEVGNLHDRNAVAVRISGVTVGYLERATAKAYRERMAVLGLAQRDATCAALICGGWGRRSGDGHFGVRLDLDWPVSRV